MKFIDCIEVLLDLCILYWEFIFYNDGLKEKKWNECSSESERYLVDFSGVESDVESESSGDDY